jgi:hypothetical protein
VNNCFSYIRAGGPEKGSENPQLRYKTFCHYN